MPKDQITQLAAAQLALKGARFVAWTTVVDDCWHGIVSTFAAKAGTVYVWRCDKGLPHTAVRGGSVDSPIAAIREWHARKNDPQPGGQN